MAFRDDLKKFRESKGTQVKTPAPIAKTTASASSGSGESGASFRDSLKKYREKQASASLEGWVNAADALLRDTDTYFQTWSSREDLDYQALSDRSDRLLVQAGDWRRQYAGNQDAIDYIDSVVKALSDAKQSYGQYFDYYGQWGSREEYDTYQSVKSDYDAKMALDLDSYEKELAKILDQQKAEGRTSILSSMFKLAGESAVTGAPSASAIQDAMEAVSEYNAKRYKTAAKQQYLNQARLLQEKAALAAVTGNADFGRYSADNRGVEALAQRWTQQKAAPGSSGYLTGNVPYTSSPIAAAYQHEPVIAYSQYDDLKYMTEDEAGIYNYYYAKEGEEKAEEYLRSIREDMNRRVAEEIFAGLKGKTVKELAYAVAAGADQFASGIHNLTEGFTEKQSYSPISPRQIASGMVREDLKEAGPKLPEWLGGGSLGQAGYDLITTTANMAPSILTSLAVGIVNPAAGSAIGSGLMGASAAGGAYQEALNQGFSQAEARGYGLLVGASEIAMEKVLGGISALGGNALGKTVVKNLDNACDALKWIAKVTGGAVSEFSEEYLQEVLTPLYRNILLGTGEEVQLFSPEALYSGILGALSGGMFEGVGTSMELSTENRNIREVYGADPQALVTEALKLNPENAFAQKMQQRLDDKKQLTAGQMKKLVRMNDGVFSGMEANAEADAEEEPEASLDRDTAEQEATAPAAAQIPENKRMEMQNNAAPAVTAEDSQAVGQVAVDGEVPAAPKTATGKKTLQVPQEETVTLEEASRKYGAQAKAMVHAYQQGQDVEKFDRAYQIAYDMGKSGVSVAYATKSEAVQYLTETQRELAYETGAAAAQMAANGQAERNRQAVNGKTVRRKGIVKGEGVTIGDLKKTFNDTQGRAYKYLATVAEVTGIDIVLYKSQVGADGKHEGTQGKFKWSDDKIYIDINAGLVKADNAGDLAKYTMLRTFAHEFTHFLEKWNPVQYNEFRKAVFEAITSQGENVHDLIEEKMTLDASGKMTYDEASREVVAEAMTDILPDANFVQELARKHQNIFQNLLSKLKEFLENLREYYRSIAPGNAREAKALKEQVGDTVKYLDSIVKLFDNVAVQAVENYQLTVDGEEATVSEAETIAEEPDSETESAVAETEKAVTEDAKPVIEAAESVSEQADPVIKADKSETTAESGATVAKIQAETTPEIPAKAETEEAKQELRKAVRMPIQGTNMEAMLEGIKNRELSMESVSLIGSVDGFNAQQRQYLVEKLMEGVYTGSDIIRIDVPYDGKFTIENTPGNVAKVLDKLKVRVNQEILFDKKTISLLMSTGDIRIVELEGRKYISNGYILIPTTDAGAEYIKTEHKGKESALPETMKEAIAGATKPLTAAPTEAKLNKKPILIFEEDGQKLYFDKRAFAPLDGGQLLYTAFRGAGLLKSVDDAGNVKGYLLGMKLGQKAEITDEKPANIKSFTWKNGKATDKAGSAVKSIEKPAEKAEIEPAQNAAKKQSIPEKKPDSQKKSRNKPSEKQTAAPATVETSVKLEDFGEKIGGARKDQWSKRGLIADDLAEMNDRERENNVKKDNVWKRPDYRKLIEGGQDRKILFVRNEIRKALNQNISYPYNVSAQRKELLQREFVDTVRQIQAMAEKVTTREELAAMGRPWLVANGYRDEKYYTDKWRKNPALQGTNYVQTIEYLVRNFDNLEKLADKANFAVDAKKKIPAGYEVHQNDENGTWFITKGSWIIMDSLPSYEKAMETLRNAATGKKKKTRFVPKQLLEVHRKGPDYRSSKDVTGQEYLDVFGFRGGEFGNWMTEKDRRVSMNYGFDALKDLADALGIEDTDISLNGNLSIAFGARGQGLSGAAAHYENERHVINLTKMNGAGSLAHEWFHALDDFLGGYGKSFATESPAKLPEATRLALRNLLTTMQYRDATQEETDMEATKSYEQAIRSVIYQVKNQFGWVEKLENGTLQDYDTHYFVRKPTEADVKKYHELLDSLLETGDPALVDALSDLRKEVYGRVIPKEDRDSIGYRLLAIKSVETAKVQKKRMRSDYYENSRRFGQLHHKDGDYWDSTIEMAARAFACYVADKTGKQNDYLSAHSDSAVTLDVDKQGKPVAVRAFPVGEERRRINGAFDQLFAALKEDGFLHEQGDVARPDIVQYQGREYLSDEAAVFRREVDSWDRDGRPEGETFILGSTGSVLQGLGAIESDVYMQGDKINKIFEDHPEMGIKEIKNIPEILENPVMVLASRNIHAQARNNTRLTVFGMVKAQNGFPVMVAFDLHPVENQLYLADMQKVVSAYTKDRSPTATLNLMQKSDVLYADKEKTASLLHTVGFQNAYRIEQSGYIGNITYEDDEVKLTGKPFGEVITEVTQNQQRRESLTDREVLTMASEQLQKEELTEAEQNALGIFRKRLDKLETLQEQRKELGRLYREQQFGSNVDREEAAKTLERMRVMDAQIQRAFSEVLSVEDKAVLKRVLQKARAVVEQQEREHGEKILKEWRKRRNDAADVKKYRTRIQKDVKELSDWIIHPSNKDIVKRVPDALKGSVIPFLSSIDFTSKSSLRGDAATKADVEFLERLEGLKNALKSQKDVKELYADYSDLPPDFAETLQRFIDSTRELSKISAGDFVINQMSPADLKTLSKIVSNLKSYIKKCNTFHANAMFRHVHEAGDSTIRELEQMANAGDRTGTVSNFLLWQQIRPAFAFERFGEGGKAIYNELRKGQAALAFNTRKIMEFSEKAYTAAEVKAWETETKEFVLGEDTVKMPVSVAMSFYELSKRPQALEHILGGGIRVATYKIKGRKVSDVGHLVTLEDVQNIVDSLTPRQREVADNLQKFMQEQGGKWGNYVSVKRFGEELFGEEHYFPINSDGRHLSANAEEHPETASLYALLNMGFTKNTKDGANNRLVLYSIFDVFANHMASIAQYNAFALPVVDAIKWFNYQQKSEPNENGVRVVEGSVRDQMDRVYGVPEENRPGSGRQGYAQNFVINILKAFNGTEAQGVPTDAMGINALRRYNVAQVAFNARVVVQQPLAVTRAALVIDYASILRGMKISPKAIEKNIWEMQQHSGIAAWKALGFYDVNISRGLTEIIKHDAKLLDQVNEIGMTGAEWADTITWAAIWAACKEEVIRKRKLTPKNEGFFEAVTELFEDVIYKTQVVDSVLTKNAFLRSKGLFARTVSSFMSEPTATASMLIDAYDKYHADIQRGLTRQQSWKKNRKMIVRTAYVYGISALVLAAVQAAADGLRDDDDYQTFLEKWMEAFGGNLVDELMPLNKLPILSDFYELAKELISVFGVDTYGNPPQSVIMQWYDSLVKGVEILYGKITGEEDRYTLYGGAYKLLQALSGMTGIPLATATREAVTAWNMIIGAMAPSLRVKTYDAGPIANIKYAYQDGYLTEMEARKQLMLTGDIKDVNTAYWMVKEWDAGEGFSRYDALYQAALNGDSIDWPVRELTENGYDEDDIMSELKSKIGTWYTDKESEIRITRQQAEGMLEQYFDMDSYEIEEVMTRWSCKAETGIAFDDIGEAYRDEDITAQIVRDLYATYGGYRSREEALEAADAKLAEWDFEVEHGFAYDDRANAFFKDKVSEDQLRAMMTGYGGMETEEAEDYIRAYRWMKGNRDYDFTVNEALSYTTPVDVLNVSVQEKGISPEIFLECRKQWSTCKGVDSDGDGKADKDSIKNQKLDVIHNMDLTDEQKDVLYFANGWAKSKLKDAPWH